MSTIHQRHISNSIRKRIRETNENIKNGADVENSLLHFVTEMQNLATRIDAEQDVEESK